MESCQQWFETIYKNLMAWFKSKFSQMGEDWKKTLAGERHLQACKVLRLFYAFETS
jgi:hypothetical protein